MSLKITRSSEKSLGVATVVLKQPANYFLSGDVSPGRCGLLAK